MRKEPIMDDPSNPLVSILIYNYKGIYLRQCFESIFSQTILNNIEVIFVNDPLDDGSWEIALEFARKYEGFITLARNREMDGSLGNFHFALYMAKGKYATLLHLDELFDPKYIARSIKLLNEDPYLRVETVIRVADIGETHRTVTDVPLVTLQIFNYNYGRYLSQCLESALTQNYANLEVCFSDNASTDDSWKIALEYARRFPGKMTLIRNRKNFGPDVNVRNCCAKAKGKYFVDLCSDDALMPGFVEKCVAALEANPDAGLAMVHRQIINKEGEFIDEPPFYNQSCVIPSNEQTAVYMMAAVNPSISQIMYNRQKTVGKTVTGGLAVRWFGSRIRDFNICCSYPMVYIKEPLLLHRIHFTNDSSYLSSSLIELFGQFVLVHQFADVASVSGLQKPASRLPEAVTKISRLCLRYCINFLEKDERTAYRYFHLSIAIDPDMNSDQAFKMLQSYWTADKEEREKIVRTLKKTENLATRKVSYDPPPNSIPLKTEGDTL